MKIFYDFMLDIDVAYYFFTTQIPCGLYSVTREDKNVVNQKKNNYKLQNKSTFALKIIIKIQSKMKDFAKIILIEPNDST